MKDEHRIAPEACRGMDYIRREIDLLDRSVIALLGRRFQYVLAASKFKTSETAVRAPARLESMLVQRREWAVAAGFDANAIEKLYRDLVTHFIEEELRRWTASSPNKA
jgi:isochorismate pyruvate lyase